MDIDYFNRLVTFPDCPGYIFNPLLSYTEDRNGAWTG